MIVYVNVNGDPTMTTTWTISDLAQEFSITPRTLRFYEDHGIVSPERQGQQRVYYPRDRTRLKLALRGKRLGLALTEILSLINLYESPGDTIPQLERYLEVLQQHKSMLEQQRQDLNQTLADIDQQFAHCSTLLSSKRAELG